VQNIREQAVVAIPLAPVIERHDEQIACLQGCQHRFAILLPGSSVGTALQLGSAQLQCIAQRTTQPIENRGLQQKAPDAFGLALQDLLDQIVHNVPVVSGKSPYKAGNVLSPAHGEGRQLEPYDPAFGAPFQCGKILCREVQAHRRQTHGLVEEFGGFGACKPQVCDAQFGQLAPGAQAGQRQRRIVAGEDGQVQPS
jgi:hypothetical protein